MPPSPWGALPAGTDVWGLNSVAALNSSARSRRQRGDRLAVPTQPLSHNSELFALYSVYSVREEGG